MRTLIGITFSFLSIPLVCMGSVSISEIAWMGGESSANHEWIELHNFGGEVVSLEGWSLSDSGSLNIALLGTIPPQSYVVLERNRSDNQYLFPTPFLIYTGALVNSGTTLTLKNQDGVIIDQVVGGENWENIGGDNETKDTAQYSGTRWVTARPTPGSVNATSDSVAVVTTASEATASTHTGSVTTSPKLESVKKKTKSLEISTASLSLSLEAPDIVYVNQLVNFSVTPSGLSSTPVMNSLQYHWNFGDLNSDGGKSVSHRYPYAGEYVVSVHGSYARHEQVARKTITVLPVTFSFSTNSVGDIQLHNDAPYEVILEGYRLHGTRTIHFPARTVMLPRGTITVPRERIGVQSTYVHLVDASDTVVATYSLLSPGVAPLMVMEVNGVAPTNKQSVSNLTAVQNTFDAVTSTPVVVGTNSSHEEFTFRSDQPSIVSVPRAPLIVQKTDSAGEDDRLKTDVSSVENEESVGDNTSDTFVWRDQLPFIGLVAITVIALGVLYGTQRRRDSINT